MSDRRRGRRNPVPVETRVPEWALEVALSEAARAEQAYGMVAADQRDIYQEFWLWLAHRPDVIEKAVGPAGPSRGYIRQRLRRYAYDIVFKRSGGSMYHNMPTVSLDEMTEEGHH